jgi:hypothetical protein
MWYDGLVRAQGEFWSYLERSSVGGLGVVENLWENVDDEAASLLGFRKGFYGARDQGQRKGFFGGQAQGAQGFTSGEKSNWEKFLTVDCEVLEMCVYIVEAKEGISFSRLDEGFSQFTKKGGRELETILNNVIKDRVGENSLKMSDQTYAKRAAQLLKGNPGKHVQNEILLYVGEKFFQP